MTSMPAVKVALGERSYEIRIGSSLLPRLGGWLREVSASRRAVVITDKTVARIHAGTVREGLEAAGFTPVVLVLPPGEEQKRLATAGRLYREMAVAGVSRQEPVLALGGGVIGDLAGFIAGTYMRGLPLLQVPTTLLAQVDSSIGGKTAIDHAGVKNLVGVFYQPVLVVADTGTLRTLPDIEVVNGLAEVIKTAAVGDKDLFEYLEVNIARVRALEPDALERVVTAAASIKAKVVAADERDEGVRGILNFGHTLGHAIEAATGFNVKHGWAVAAGMVAAARMSCRLGLLSDGELRRLLKLIEGAGLTTDIPEAKEEAILQAMKLDKKVRQDKLRFVLLRSLGDAFISDGVALDLVKEAISGK